MTQYELYGKQVNEILVKTQKEVDNNIEIHLSNIKK
jgi:hypothetical protein